MLSELPFFTLDPQEFLKTTGGWVHQSFQSIIESKDLFADIITSPETENELQESPYNNSIQSGYFTVKQSGKFFFEAKKHHGFSLMHFNIRSLPKNLTSLEDIICTVKESPEIIAISETKLQEKNIYNINIPGYFFLNTNSSTSAGGVGLYVSKELSFIRRRDLEQSDDGIESCWIEIMRKKQKNVVVGCVYRHPSKDCTNLHAILKDQLCNLNNKGKEVFVLGDININFLNYNRDIQTSDYLDMLLGLGYMPLITKATRITDHTATLIDHIYTNVPQKTTKAGICLADISDHLPVFCTVANRLPLSQETKHFRDFSHFNKDLFLNDLEAIDFNNLVNEDVNQSMNNVISVLKSLSDKHAPARKLSNNKRKQSAKPWISNAILKSIKRRQKLFKSHFLSGNSDKVTFYKSYNNKLNRIKNAAKKAYFQAQFRLNSENLKTTWKLIGTIINGTKGCGKPPITKLIYKNRCYTDKANIAHKLNTHFINIGHELADSLPPNNYDDNPNQYIKRSFRDSFAFRSILVHEVYDLLLGINLNKATIGVPRKIIKLASSHICESLTFIFNQSLQQGVVPDILKISRVTPIDKGGEVTDPTNYRPISTLSTFTQIFEKLIHKQLVNYIDKKKILFQFQFGFRKGHSTAEAITDITNTLRKAIDNNLYTCGVFLDFSKAFDTVNHMILLSKLDAYGIRGIPLKWFQSYLSDRKQYVELDGVKSPNQTMLCGVPQGSTLGPLLFLIYINDLPNSSEHLSFKIFADDTNVFASAKDLKTLEHLMNSELAKVKRWCDINKLSINMDKTNFMVVKSVRKKDIPISLNIISSDGSIYSLERKQCIKYLGVMIDESLSWKYHISFVCSRISRNTGIISKLRYYLSVKQLTQIYYNLIYPYISYGIIAWGSIYKTHISKIQNQIVRLIFFATAFGSETENAKPLLNLLGLLTVNNIYRLQVSKFVHSWHKGSLPVLFDNMFQYASNVHHYNTRYTAKKNLYKPSVRTNIGKQSISFMATNIWKDLPTYLKNLSVFTFPKKIKHFLLSEQQTK